MPSSVPTETVQLDHRSEHQVAAVLKAERAPLPHPILLARRVGVGLLGVQLVVMVGFSIVLYRRYDLTQDYAQYAQAWYAIAHGHLNPWDSVHHFAFWTNDGELVLWPLALLYLVFPHAIDLLLVQDLAVVATELVVFWWIIDVLEQARPRLSVRTASLVVVAVVVVLMADPWAYQTIAFDFHTHPLAAFFVVLAGRALWSNHRRHLVWWVLGALMCNALAGLWVAAVGVSGVLTGHGRRQAGAAMIVVGIAWMAVLSSASGHFGGNVATNFAYLVHHPGAHAGLLAVALGALTHPGAVLAHIAVRWPYLLVYLGPLGLVGIASPWALPIIAAVFLPSMLAAPPVFIRVLQSFQQWPALPFALVGSVMVLVGLRRRRFGSRIVRGTVVLWATMLSLMAAVELPAIPTYWVADTPAAAAELAHLHATIAPTAEVIASQGVAGRFADRADIGTFWYRNASFPITAHTVVFIITATQGVGEASPSATSDAVRTIEHLGARPILARDGIDAFIWHPVHQRRIVLP